MKKIDGSKVLSCAVLLIAVSSASVAGDAEDLAWANGDRGLERRTWWPLEAGPHYGDVAPADRGDPRVLRLPVGSFDTRGPGWDLPEPLRLSADRAARPGTPWLVQFDGPIDAADRRRLRDAGATIHAYRPSYAFVVRAEHPGRLSGVPGVVWTGPYHPAYRLEPNLGHAPTLDAAEARNDRLFVRIMLFDASDRPAVLAALAAAGAAVDATTYATYLPGDRVYATVDVPTLFSLVRRDDVRWIDGPSRTGFGLNAETKVVVQGGSIAAGTPLWDAGIDGDSQVVAVMDSGLDVDTILMSDTDLDAGTPGPSHRKVLVYSGWSSPPDLQTCGGTSGYSHGTNSTQSAAGNHSDFASQSGDFDGVARGAKVVFQDVGPSDLICCLIGCLDVPASLIGMYDEVRANGGHLTNGSFAICSYGTYGPEADEIDEYAWNHKDFLGFFSGGNGGGGNACPGTNKNNISSGGHYQFPFENEFYGSTGPSPDGRVGPTVLAPACDRANGNPAPYDYDTSTSIQSSDNDITGPPSTSLNQGSCGTSFSSPYLMGVAALVRDYFEKGMWPNGVQTPADALDPTGALVKAALINGGDFVDGCVGCASPGLMGSMGMGRANLSNTLPVDGDARTVPGARVVDRGAADGLATGGSFEEIVDVTDATVPLRATVVWVDRPGSTLVNDLRLVVTGPAGDATQTYFGNNFGTGAYSTSEAAGGLTNDAANVFESVRIDPAALVEGAWTVRVEGTNVPMGDPLYNDTQPFALIVSGGFDSSALPPEVSPVGSGSPLAVTATDATTVTWSWEDLADPSVTYQLYRGTIGSIAGGTYDHGSIDAANCTIANNSTTLSDKTDGIDGYYLVGATKNGNSGSLGSDSDGLERPPASPACP